MTFCIYLYSEPGKQYTFFAIIKSQLFKHASRQLSSFDNTCQSSFKLLILKQWIALINNQATYLVHVLATALKQSGKNVIFSMFSSRLESKFRAQIQTSRTQRQRIKGRVTLIYETDEVAIISLL